MLSFGIGFCGYYHYTILETILHYFLLIFKILFVTSPLFIYFSGFLSVVFWGNLKLSGTRGVSREKLIALAIGIGLDVEETQRLLTLGQSGTLYPKVRRDAAIICCIKEHMDLFETNEHLNAIDEKVL